MLVVGAPCCSRRAMLVSGAPKARQTVARGKREARSLWIIRKGLLGSKSRQKLAAPRVCRPFRAQIFSKKIPGASARDASHVIAVTLALFRDLPLALRRQGEGIWAQNEIQARPPLPTLAGSQRGMVPAGLAICSRPCPGAFP